jgi:hypothetical protein
VVLTVRQLDDRWLVPNDTILHPVQAILLMVFLSLVLLDGSEHPTPNFRTTMTQIVKPWAWCAAQLSAAQRNVVICLILSVFKPDWLPERALRSGCWGLDNLQLWRIAIVKP